MTCTPRPDHRRILSLLTAFALGSLVTRRLTRRREPSPQIGHWRSQAGFEAYRAAYDEAMSSLPEPDRTHDVRTDFGSVRVYVWTAKPDAPDDALPVVLVPGIRSGVPMWSENLPYWIGDRTLYAMDAVGDAGLSTHAVPFESFDHHADWLEQALAELKVDRAHMIGHSFGGAIAAAHALQYPGRVASLTLLEPVMVLHAIPLGAYVWGSVLILPVPQPWKDRALAEIGGVTVAEVRERTPVSVMIDEGSKHYSSTTLKPRTFTDSEWQSMEMPIRVEIASDKSMAGGQPAAERARSLGIDVTVRPNTTHSLPMQAAAELGPELQAYWTAHDR